jgi:putative ABC transport system permease protein
MRTFLKDLAYSLRTFRQNPGFAITAIAAIALGIGANTAIFSIVNTVLLKPLSAPDPDRLVQFMLTYPAGWYAGGSPQQLFLWQSQDSVVQDVAAHRLELMNLTSGADPEQVPVARVTSDFFRLYGVPILQGRTFLTTEDRRQGAPVAVLSHGLWTRHFAHDAKVLGTTVTISGAAYTVIGILGPNYNAEQFDQRPDIFIPFQMEPDSAERDCYCRIVARLKPGVSIENATARLQLAAAEYRRKFPDRLGVSQGFALQPLREAMIGNVRPSLLIFAGAVAFVLLIACTNVANLLFIRANSRKREIAIRAALGAGRGRLVRQLLTESVLLSAIGGILGLALGLFGIRIILASFSNNPILAPLNTVNIPRIGGHESAVDLDWRVLIFTAVISIATGIIFGLIPALQASRSDLNVTLKDSSGGGAGFRQNKIRSVLVIGEVALALVLLVGAALLIRTSIALRAVDPGFDSHNVLIMQMSLAGTRFEKTSEMDQVIQDGARRLHGIPGVLSVASSCCVPLETVWQLSYSVAGREPGGRARGMAGWTFVSPEYFDAFKVPILRGRAFSERDDAAAPGVVIINQAMAKRVWPGYPASHDPLGERLIIGRGVRPEYDHDPPRQIVGIVGDIRDSRLDSNPRPAMYVPIAQLPDAINALNLRLLPIAWVVRTGIDPNSLGPAIKEGLRQATGMPVARVRSMNEVAAQSTARTQFNTLLMIIFGFSALLLAAVGIYGLIAYSVQQRTREIGIRLALGAESGNVRNMVIQQGMGLALVGVALGLAAAFGLTRLIAGMLFGVKAWDPTVFVAVPILLTLVAFAAVSLPARRATRVNPVDALRSE